MVVVVFSGAFVGVATAGIGAARVGGGRGDRHKEQEKEDGDQNSFHNIRSFLTREMKCRGTR